MSDDNFVAVTVTFCQIDRLGVIGDTLTSVYRHQRT